VGGHGRALLNWACLIKGYLLVDSEFIRGFTGTTQNENL
jgi:hypothetical protein